MVDAEADGRERNELCEGTDIAHDQEGVQPRRHEQEIENPRREDEGANEPPDLLAVLQPCDQGNEINQHPHGAGVEAVGQRHHRR